MKYFKYDDEHDFDFDHGVTYVEVYDGYTYRQITVSETEQIASNILYPKWGMQLAEGQIDYDIEDEITEIHQKEFDKIWSKHLLTYQAHWDNKKQAYPIGTDVEGSIQIFYPQGVIIYLSNGTLGVSNYNDCKASAQPECMYQGYKVTATVANYDEKNH